MENTWTGPCQQLNIDCQMKLVYYEACRTEVGACDREVQLKTGFG